MGTDITVFLEYWQDSDGSPPWGDQADPTVVVWSHRRVHSLADSYFQVGRNYRLFGALAGVRSTVQPLYPPRELPPIISMEVAERVRRPIHADDVPDEEVLAEDGVHYTAALQMVERGCRYMGPPADGKRYDFITDDLYSASWLYLDEIDLALSHHSISDYDGNYLFAAMMSAMRTLESHLGARATRLVFWFA